MYVGFSFADAIAGRQFWRSGRMLVASVLLAITLFVITALLLFSHALAVARDPRATPEMLLEISRAWLPLGRRDVGEALLKNPVTPEEVLTAVVDAGRDDRLVSLAGAHPNTPMAALEKIAAGPLAYDRVAGLAGNGRLTPAMAQRLAVSTVYSKRASCEQIARVVESGSEVLRNTAQSQLKKRSC